MSESAKNFIEAIAAIGMPFVALGVWIVVRIFNLERKFAVMEEKMSSGFDKLKSMLAERRPR